MHHTSPIHSIRSHQLILTPSIRATSTITLNSFTNRSHHHRISPIQPKTRAPSLPFQPLPSLAAASPPLPTPFHTILHLPPPLPHHFNTLNPSLTQKLTPNHPKPSLPQQGEEERGASTRTNSRGFVGRSRCNQSFVLYV